MISAFHFWKLLALFQKPKSFIFFLKSISQMFWDMFATSLSGKNHGLLKSRVTKCLTVLQSQCIGNYLNRLTVVLHK